MKKELSKHYYKAELKTWKWNPKTNNIDESYESVQKDFSTQQLKETLTQDKLAIVSYSVLGAICGCVGFIGNWIFGVSFIIGVALLASLCSTLQYYYSHYYKEYSYDLGQQDGFMEDSRLTLIFLEEIAERHELKLKEEKLAERWRKKHPLEEKVRLALSGNPNYVAELLRYCELVKSQSDLKEHITKASNIAPARDNEISVKYITPQPSDTKDKSKGRKKN